MPEERTIRILLLGDAGVGKSTFISRLTRGRNAPPNAPLPILQDFQQPFVFDIKSRKGTFRLEFFDTASPDNYTLTRPDMIVLCFDVNERQSLDNVKGNWKYQVETHFNYNELLPIMLLGLQRDLRQEGDPNMVQPFAALNVAQEMRCDRYAECSAVTGELCNETFEDLVQMAVNTSNEDGGKTAPPPCSVM